MYRESLGLDKIAKTKTQLYRDIKVGTVIICKEDRQDPSNTGKKMRVLNKGEEVLTLESEDGKRVRLEIPRASSIKYVGAELVVYGVGKRELTETERQVIANVKQKDRVSGIRYLENMGYKYLLGDIEQAGKRYDKGCVRDKNIAGCIVAIYQIPNAYSKTTQKVRG